MKIAVVGATGLVGTKMIEVLAERNFPISELIPVASEKSIGKTVELNGKSYEVVGMQTCIDMKPAIALFSAGGSTSLEWAPAFAEAGITVIDNSSAWRMDTTKKLVVPEINADVLNKEDKIIPEIHILHTETLTNDMRNLGYDDFNNYDNLNKHKVNCYDYLNDDSIKLINDFYHFDFEFFNYTKIEN